MLIDIKKLNLQDLNWNWDYQAPAISRKRTNKDELFVIHAILRIDLGNLLVVQKLSSIRVEYSGTHNHRKNAGTTTL